MLRPSTILLRVCCIPVDSLLLAGNPKLFALCEHLDEVTKLLEHDSRMLANDILACINANRLPRPQSKSVGAVVGRLGRLAQLREQDLEAVEGGVLNRDLVTRLYAFQRAQRDAQDLKRSAMGLLAEEPARAASALIDGVLSRPDGVELLRHRNPQFFDRRLVDSRGVIYWSGKQGCRNAAYLYSIITRATLRTVPRDWHTQVAFVPVGEADEAPSRTGRIACLWTENVHALRSRTRCGYGGRRQFGRAAEPCPYTLEYRGTHRILRYRFRQTRGGKGGGPQAQRLPRHNNWLHRRSRCLRRQGHRSCRRGG